jgi:hypothetical protein
MRPYGDPYAEESGSTLADVDWKVDDNIQRLLYDDEDMDVSTACLSFICPLNSLWNSALNKFHWIGMDLCY